MCDERSWAYIVGIRKRSIAVRRRMVNILEAILEAMRGILGLRPGNCLLLIAGAENAQPPDPRA